jgi:acetyl esterase
MADGIRLDGRIALVTGAAGVIGAATMRLLAERGARIIAVDRNQQQLQTAIRDLPGSAQALAVTADVTQEGEVAGYVRGAIDKFGAIDVFYNNAGIEGDIASIVNYSLESFRRVLDVNVVGVFLGLKHVLPVMLKQRQQACGDRFDQERGAGMHGDRCARELRLPGPYRQPDAECDHHRTQSRQRADPHRQDRRPDSCAAARTSVGSRFRRGLPCVRRGKLCLRLSLHRRRRTYCELEFFSRATGLIMPVTLDPDAAAVFKAFQEAGRPPYESVSPAEARELYLRARVVTNPEPPELRSAQALAIPSPAGTIPARVYTPKRLRQINGLAPGLVFFHGGGWVIGNLDSHDVVCRTLAHVGELIVISVDYRLSPEHKFPAAVEDSIAATGWIAKNAGQLGIDATRLMVGGDSAGGNLAAVVAIHARDAGNGPKLAGQVLIYPGTDFRMTHPSHSEQETSILLTHSVIRWFRDHYLNSSADVDDWRASPARVENLAGLPPAYVLTAGADPLRDEGDEFARRLKQAGVPVTYRNFPGQFHGFFTMGKLLPQANVAAREIGDWLKALG